ncbi:MAG: hypothetical protein JXA15_08735 [Spirochaetales bacterium]|nr:hypothetical protein [Spirochaetales bacterium]
MKDPRPPRGSSRPASGKTPRPSDDGPLSARLDGFLAGTPREAEARGGAPEARPERPSVDPRTRLPARSRKAPGRISDKSGRSSDKSSRISDKSGRDGDKSGRDGDKSNDERDKSRGARTRGAADGETRHRDPVEDFIARRERPSTTTRAARETRSAAPPRNEAQKPATRVISRFAAPPNAGEDLSHFLEAVEEALPLDPARRRMLKGAVLDLWRDLTADRAERHLDYMGDPAVLSAYARYFMAWNVVRLVPVLASLPLEFPDDATILDVGSGPLALPIALWIARPELRAKRLRIVCVDRARRALDAGHSILSILRELTEGPEDTWTVERRKAVFPDIGEAVKADLVTAANVFTEFFWSDRRPIGVRAVELMRRLSSLAAPGGRVLVVEPGEPRSGAMLAALREVAILGGASPESPCPHERACPMPGAFGGLGERDDDEARFTRARSALPAVVHPRRRAKMPWCHVPVPLDHAPARLSRFSEEVGLPKERLTVSWLALKLPEAVSGEHKPQGKGKAGGPLRVRLVSDPIRLPGGRTGRYACSDQGYTLALGAAAELPAGTLVETSRPQKKERDDKSGAVIAPT